MNLYQSITKVTNFYLEDIQKAIENCEKHLNTIISRIQEVENLLGEKDHNSSFVQELIYKNNCLLAENCFFIEEQNKLIEHYQNAINIIKHKHLLTFSPISNNISEDIQKAFQEMLNFYKEKDMTENVSIIESFLTREKDLFQV